MVHFQRWRYSSAGEEASRDMNSIGSRVLAHTTRVTHERTVIIPCADHGRRDIIIFIDYLNQLLILHVYLTAAFT